MQQVKTDVKRHTADEPIASVRARQLTRWVVAIFFLSGVSGLMYEVVWVRMLTRMLGSTVYATSTVLSGFMAGLALGSFLIGRFIDRSRRLLLVYSLLEFGIAISALFSLLLPDWLTPLYQRMYELAGGSRGWQTAGQVAVGLVVLLLPTSLMGATLPTLCAFGTRQLGRVGQSAGMFYALNTLGGVVGVLVSGFVFLGELGERNTVFIGVVCNLIAGAAALILGNTLDRCGDPPGSFDERLPQVHPIPAQRGEAVMEAPYSVGVGRAVVACFAASGFAALASEVVWSRLLTMYQGTSIYAFSAMLGVMLTGMGVGSFWMSRRIDLWDDPLRVLGRLQLALGLVTAGALHVFNRMGTPPRPNLATPYEARIFYLLAAPVILIGPMGLLGGAIFPVAARCYTRSLRAVGRNISELYTWNTVGCILGPLIAGFCLIPAVGTSHSAVIVAGLSMMLGIALLWSHSGGLYRSMTLMDWGFAAISVVLLATAGDPYYRHLQRRMGGPGGSPITPFLHVEDATGTTTAFIRDPSDPMDKVLWVNGVGMTVLALETKLMAHLPISLAKDPHDVLVVCFGMGTTVRSASRHARLNITTVEMMPAVLRCFGLFHPDGPALLDRSNVHAMADDGRNYLLVRPEQYDVITVDPAPPIYSAGTVNLYSREFFELCRSRLRPGGVMCLWVPPSNRSEIKMILRTFLDVFEHTSVWSGVRFKGLYLLGSHHPLERVPEKIENLFRNPAVVADLTEWNDDCDRPEKMRALFIAEGADLKKFLSQTPIISDDRPYTEFPLWRALFGGEEYSEILDGPALRQVLAEGTN